MSEQKDLTYEVDAYDVTWAIEENGEPCAKVGYQYEGVGGQRLGIPPLEDGHYRVVMPLHTQAFFSHLTRTTRTKEMLVRTRVSVLGGEINIMSCRLAVAEYLRATGDWHTFIENVICEDNVLWFYLGS